MEIVGRVSGRHRWTVEQKLAILRDAFGPGGSVRDACDRHEIGNGQTYTWLRQAMSGELTGSNHRRRLCLPRLILLSLLPRCFLRLPHHGFQCPWPDRDRLPSGIRLTVDAAVDTDALARVIAVLGR